MLIKLVFKVCHSSNDVILEDVMTNSLNMSYECFS